MRKSSLLVIGLVGASLGLFAQLPDPRTGNWIGSLPGSDLSIYFRIKGDSIAGYTADWNSPAQKALGMECKSVIINKDSLVIGTAVINASFRGRYLPHLDSIAGAWQQNGQTFLLGLRRMLRPQTPQSPFPYRSDSVEYNNIEGTVHLGATLTRPSGDAHPSREKKYPVVILITGSGQQDRDETIFEHRPFAIIADYLTRHGMAVLRVDDRGIGKSKGDYQHASSADFAEDVITSIRYLTKRADIDITRIGLIGHSEGGLIAPIVYSRWPHLNCIISLAGTGVPGWTISLRQQTYPVKKISQAVYDAYYPLVKDKMAIIEADYGKSDSLTLSQVKASYSRWRAGLPDSIAEALHVKNVNEAVYGFQVAAELKPWLRYFYHTDPSVFWQQVKCPVLALDGSKDTQVDAAENIPAIRAALLKGGNRGVTTRVFQGLNHLFQHAGTGDFAEYALIDESFAPEVLQVMGDWIAKIDKLYP